MQHAMDFSGSRIETLHQKVAAGLSNSLSDSEILGIVSGNQYSAQRALQRAGGLRQVMESSPAALRTFGVSSRGSTRLAAVRELASRYLAANLVKDGPLTEPTAAADYLKSKVRHLEHEEFCCLFLDNRHQPVGFESLFRSTIDASAVYPREVAKACLQKNAAAVILCHNHPSGVAIPSQADYSITDTLVKALGLLEIRVLDHLVIGDDDYTSLAQKGRI